MVIGVLSVDVRLYGPQSLKDKRSIIKGTLARIQNKFHISAAEVEFQEDWHRAGLGFSCVSNEAGHADSMLQSVLGFLESDPEMEVIDVFTETIHY